MPAAYALARRDFPGKRLVMLLFLLPLLVPPITFGIPLATVLYQAGLAGTMSGVVLANLVPTVPFVILVMIPFIEQIDPRIEAAARVFGASTVRLFIHVLLPLLLPGILAALLLVLVRTIAMFELTFLTAGPTSQTLVVALYYAVFAAGVRAVQSIDAMAVIYMVTTLVWLLDRAALRQPDADRHPRQAGAGALRRLSDATLGALPDDVARPRYDRSGTRIGIVHLGIGAFHRAHQAVYVDDRLAAGESGWAICGASLRSPDTVRRALRAERSLHPRRALRRGRGAARRRRRARAPRRAGRS